MKAKTGIGSTVERSRNAGRPRGGRGAALLLSALACGGCDALLDRLGGAGTEPPDETESEAGAPAAADAALGFSCPAGTERREGVYPEAAEKWWRFSARSEGEEKLRERWGFPAWEPMKEGDRHTWCERPDGTWHGSYQQLREPDGTRPLVRVQGEYDEGRATGTWNGGWESEGEEVPAFQGLYREGERYGDWSFYGPPGTELSVTGRFVRDRMHGTWRFESPEGSTETGYLLGVRHGAFVRRGADGALTRGQFLAGRKHGMWIEGPPPGEAGDPLPPGSEPEEGGRPRSAPEMWILGESRGAVEPSSAESGSRRGGSAREEPVRAWLEAWLEAGLSGGWASTEALLGEPILLDFADSVVSDHVVQHGLPIGDTHLLVERYEVESLRLGRQSGTAIVSFRTQCEVSGDGLPSPAPRETTYHIHLRFQQGLWKPSTVPGTFNALYKSAWEQVEGAPTGPAAERYEEICSGAGPGAGPDAPETTRPSLDRNPEQRRPRRGRNRPGPGRGRGRGRQPPPR